MNVVDFKRPAPRKKIEPPSARRPLAEFALVMAVIGVVFFMLPTIWSSAPVHLLVVIHLLVAVVYFQQGPRIAAGAWIAVTLVVVFLAASPSPVTLALNIGAAALTDGFR